MGRAIYRHKDSPGKRPSNHGYEDESAEESKKEVSVDRMVAEHVVIADVHEFANPSKQ